MFTALLTGDQQRALNRAVHAIALIDGKVHRPESELLDLINREGGLLVDFDVQGEAASTEELVSEVAAAFDDESPDAACRRGFVAELAIMVAVDSEEDSAELRLLASLMDAVKVPSGEVGEFLAFGRRVAELNRDGAALLGPR